MQVNLRGLVNDVIVERIMYSLENSDIDLHDDCDSEESARNKVRFLIYKILMDFVNIAEDAYGDAVCHQESASNAGKLSDRRILELILERITHMAASSISQEQFDTDLNSLKSAVSGVQDHVGELTTTVNKQNGLIDQLQTALESAISTGKSAGGDLSKEEDVLNQIKGQVDDLNTHVTGLTGDVDSKNQAVSAALAQVQNTGSTAVAGQGTSDPSSTLGTAAPIEGATPGNTNLTGANPAQDNPSTLPSTITPVPAATTAEAQANAVPADGTSVNAAGTNAAGSTVPVQTEQH